MTPSQAAASDAPALGGKLKGWATNKPPAAAAMPAGTGTPDFTLTTVADKDGAQFCEQVRRGAASASAFSLRRPPPAAVRLVVLHVRCAGLCGCVVLNSGRCLLVLLLLTTIVVLLLAAIMVVVVVMGAA